MAERRDYYFGQLVTEDELDDGFAGLEQADRDLAVDLGLIGVTTGMTVSQHTPQNLTVDVSGGQGYDQDGQRLNIASTQVVDVSTDSSAVATTVAVAGNEKWVSLFVKFARALSDPRLDGNNVTVYFVREETFEIERVQGAEAPIGTATRPALGADKILIADVQRTNGQTQILTANISTTRKQWAFQATAGAHSVAAGTPEEAIAAVLTHHNNHVVDTTQAHDINSIGFGNGAGGAIAAHTNNLALADTEFFVRLAPSGAFNLTGIVAPSTANHNKSRFLVLMNSESSGNNLTLKHEDAGSTNINRFRLRGGVDKVLAPGDSTIFFYMNTLGTSSRWQHIGGG